MRRTFLPVLPLLAAMAVLVVPAHAAQVTKVATFPAGLDLARGDLQLDTGRAGRYVVVRQGPGRRTQVSVGEGDRPPTLAEGIGPDVLGPVHFGAELDRSQVLVYTRLIGGQRDLFAWDVRTRVERPLSRVNDPEVSELEGVMDRGAVAFTRRSGRAGRSLFYRTPAPNGKLRKLADRGGERLILDDPARVIQVRRTSSGPGGAGRAVWRVEQISTKRRLSWRFDQPVEGGRGAITGLDFVNNVLVGTSSPRGASAVLLEPFADDTYGVLPMYLDAMAFVSRTEVYGLAYDGAPGAAFPSVSLYRITDLDLTGRSRTAVPRR